MKLVTRIKVLTVQTKLGILNFYKLCRILVKFQMQTVEPVKVNMKIVALVKVQTRYAEFFLHLKQM